MVAMGKFFVAAPVLRRRTELKLDGFAVLDFLPNLFLEFTPPPF
jgi:hypothetical protein